MTFVSGFFCLTSVCLFLLKAEETMERGQQRWEMLITQERKRI